MPPPTSATGSEVNTHEIRACQCQSSKSLSIRPPTKSVRSILRFVLLLLPSQPAVLPNSLEKKFCYSIRRVQSDGNGAYMIGNLRYSTGGSPALIFYDEKGKWLLSGIRSIVLHSPSLEWGVV